MSGCGNENPDDDVSTAIKASMDKISDEEPKVKAFKPESFADMNFIAELDKSGYIDSLYKNKRD